MTSLSYRVCTPRRLRTTASFVLASVLAVACGSGDDVPDHGEEHDASPDSSEGGATRRDASPDADARRDASTRDADAGSVSDASMGDASVGDATLDPTADGAPDVTLIDASPDVAQTDAAPSLEASTPDDGHAPTDAAPADADDGSTTEAGAPLGDACTDTEWRALTVPLAVVRIDSGASRRHVVIDAEGRCRRGIDATDVLLSPDGRTLAYWTAGGSSIALAAVQSLSAPTVLAGSRALAFSPDGRRLAFERDAQDSAGNTVSTAFIGGADGSAVRALPASFRAWSPDSTAFASSDAQDRVHIDCADHPCDRSTAVMSNPPGDLVWSPDSARVAIRSWTGNRLDVQVIDAQSTALTQVTHEPANTSAGVPRWSPSGTQLAFDEWTIPGSGPWTFEIAVVCANGSCRHPLASPLHQGMPGLSVAWAPSGARIAFTSQTRNGAPIHVLTVCPDGSCSTDLGEAEGFTWAKDGDFIYHSLRDPSSGQWSMVASCIDGSCSHRLGAGRSFVATPIGEFDDARLSHAGQALGYFDHQTSVLFVAVGVAPARQVSAPGELVVEPVAPPDDREFFHWTLDDRRIVYVTSENGVSRFAVKSACVDGSCHATLLGALSSGNPVVVGVLAPPSP